MRAIQYFCTNKLVGNILRRFEISQGNLYHYTSKDASTGINKGEIWITRADCFLDPREISHGIDILICAANYYLSGGTKKSFVNLLSIFQSKLKNTYVMSLSLDPQNQYLKDNYAVDGTIIEFKEVFPTHLGATGWHSVPESKDSYRLYYLTDLYSAFEGFVVYGDDLKKELAREVCKIYANLTSLMVHDVDELHFKNVLIQSIVLFKEESYALEKEYRIALIRKDNSSNPFENMREYKGKSIFYIKAEIPRNSSSLIGKNIDV